MAKKKSPRDAGVASALANIEASTRASTGGLLDDVLVESVKSAQDRQVCEGQIFFRSDILARLIFLPVPALSTRFLFQSEGWPLGRFVLIDGFQEACKSALTYEIGTWHRRLGGNFFCIETEVKDAAHFRDSFFNYEPNAWFHSRAATQDKWNEQFFYWVEQLHYMFDGGRQLLKGVDGKSAGYRDWPARGRIAPMCISVDSISAVLLDSQAEKIQDEGSPTLAHPLGARLLSDFFKVGPKSLIDYPITFLAVSHLKMSNDPKVPHIQVRNTTGGMAPKFQMTYEIEMRRKRPAQYSRVHKKYGEIYSIELLMTIRKNSLGNKEDGLPVEMTWYFDPDDVNPLTGEKRQKSYFDWHSASIELLHECAKTGDDGMGFSSKRAKTLRDLVDVQLDVNRRLCSSSSLGISPDAKLSYYEAGQVLEHKLQTDPAFAAQVYEVMGVRRQTMFQRGVDFRQQIADNRDRHMAMEAAYKLPPATDVPLVNPLDILGDSGPGAS